MYFAIVSFKLKAHVSDIAISDLCTSKNDPCNLFFRGADPRAVNREGKTALEMAVESNFVDNEVLAVLSDSNG